MIDLEHNLQPRSIMEDNVRRMRFLGYAAHVHVEAHFRFSVVGVDSPHLNMPEVRLRQALLPELPTPLRRNFSKVCRFHYVNLPR